MRLLVTGGAGFIGSAFVRLVLAETSHHVTVIDKLTYAGNLENLDPVSGDSRFQFIKADICDAAAVEETLRSNASDAIIHFAAESHVDRSILSPSPVFETNLRGTFTLLEAARTLRVPRFVHVSTDEVYGSLAAPDEADEDTPVQPSSPYSATKAGSDLLALSYYRTYSTPVIVTRASNNYGPFQFPEKLIPLMVLNAFEDRPLPVYGDGMQVRDWLHVDDHCRGILSVLEKGREGQIYNIGGNCSLPNIEVVQRILHLTGRPESLIQYVTDRPGHDRRYALSSAKLTRETSWAPRITFEEGLLMTIDWYRSHPSWTARVRSGEYRNYYDQNYGSRSILS